MSDARWLHVGAQTPQDNLKEEEKLKKELQLRLAYAGFLQETVTAMAVKKKSRLCLGLGLLVDWSLCLFW